MVVFVARILIWAAFVFLGRSGEVPLYQIECLQALYDSTNGPSWNFAANETANGEIWNFTAIDGNISNPCVSDWQGIYCSSTCTDSDVCNITHISLESFGLAGSLPTILGTLNTLNMLDFWVNSLTGTVPTELGLLKMLTYLDLGTNKLSGTIPTELGELSLLNHFWLDTNRLIGATIPTELGKLTNVIYFALQENSLEGTFPSFLGQFTSAVYINLAFNVLTGTLPSELGVLGMLTQFSFGENQLYGTIPSSYGNLSSLEALILFDNSLTGTLPSSLGLLTLLESVSLSRNQLSGTLPTAFVTISALVFFSVRANQLSGSESVQLLLQVPQMRVLMLSDNFFSGDVDISSVSPLLGLLRLDNNLFTGSKLLPQLCAATGMYEVLISSNAFTGSLPSCIGNWSDMLNFDVGSNVFSGSIPAAFGSFKTLGTVVLSSNHFSGPLVDVFNSTIFTTVVVSDNGFSGSLPFTMFNSSSLTTFIASKNCFVGTLSSEMCLASSLRALALSGLTAGSGCAISVPVLNTYETRRFDGTIPSCLFSMPNLAQLYLDGNAMDSSLYDIPESSLLQNLSLSHNMIEGSIPSSILTRQNMQILDLSFNHLTGTLKYMCDFNVSSPDTSVNLRSNHLSGKTPPSLTHTAASIDILAGNWFACDEPSDLPQSDPKAHKYSCGSKMLYQTLYTCIALLVIIVAYGLRVVYKHADTGLLVESYRVSLKYLNWQRVRAHSGSADLGLANDDGSVAHLMDHLQTILHQHRLCCVFIGGLITLTCVPILLSLKFVNGGGYTSLTYQYGWWLSLAFLEGAGPGIIVAVFWLAIFVAVMVFEYTYIDRRKLSLVMTDMDTYQRASEVKTGTHIESSPETSMLVTISAIIVNLVLSILANSAYVYVVMTQSTQLQVLAAWGLVGYKLFWTYVVVVPWLRVVHGKFLLVLIIMICNIILIPMLATMAVDVSCFRLSFFPEPPITTSYVYFLCDIFNQNNNCLEYSPIQTSVSFIAPITYNEQCFAAVLTNYVPIYIITYGFIGVSACIVHILAAVYLAEGVAHKDERVVKVVHWCKKLTIFPLRYWLPIESADDLTVNGEYRQNFYRARFHAIHCVLVLTLLLTFGLAYPPLGFVLIVNIVLHTLVFQLSVFYHYKQMGRLPSECVEIWKLVLMDEIRMMHKVVHGSRTAMYIFCSVFVGFALYDVMAENSSQLAVSLICCLILVTGLCTVVGKYLRKNEISVSDKVEEIGRRGRAVSIELSAGINRMRTRTGSNNSNSSKQSSHAKERSLSNMSVGSDEVVQNIQNPMMMSTMEEASNA